MKYPPHDVNPFAIGLLTYRLLIERARSWIKTSLSWSPDIARWLVDCEVGTRRGRYRVLH